MANSLLQNLLESRAQVIAEHEETLKSIDLLIARFGAGTAVISPAVSASLPTASSEAAPTAGRRGRPKGSTAAASSEPKAPKTPKEKKPKSLKKIRLNMSDVAEFTIQALSAEPKTKNEIAAMYANANGLPADFTPQVERGVYITLMGMEKNKTVNTQKLATDARIKLYSKK